MSKVPPQNLDAEAAILGAMFLSEEAAHLASGLVHGSDFYKPAHRQIFDTMMQLVQDGQACDTVIVANRLGDEGLEAIGGAGELVALMSSSPTISNIESYCKIVRDKATLRKLIAYGVDMSTEGYTAKDAEAMLMKAEDDIFSLSSNVVQQGPVEAATALGDMIENMSDAWLQPDGIVGTPSGFRDLDYKLSGLRDASLIILGARPAMGKSALAVNIATNVAVDQKLPVLYFNLEMRADEVMQRVFSARSRVSFNQDGGNLHLSNDDWVRMNAAAKEIAEAPLLIDSDPTVTAVDIASRARKAQTHYGQLGLIVVDYLQLMTGHNTAESRQLEVSEISRRLKILAMDLNVPILALSQLSRSLESRNDKRPMLSDLRESGSIEQDADAVLFLYRDSEYNPESEERGTVEVIVSKHRQGGKGTIKMAFIGPQTRFATIARGL